ncbi:MAG: type VI secretion system-associated FHA domain protein TagH [Marinovum sp.]|nr:type VI secretion system-associated FHA domain protein TagH [Marinovum sp.]
MAVVLKFQSTGSIPNDGSPIPMRGPSLTMGRGEENDLCLPDPERVLSKRHCAIEDHNGSVVVVDISTNGTFLNYGKLPLGATPTPLNDGDILSVGPYEILVNITSDDTRDFLPDPLADAPVSHGIADAAPSPMDLLDAPGDGGDFLDNLLGGKEGPVGPRSVDRAEPDDDGLLPPLGDDDILPPSSDDPFAQPGPSMPMHNTAGQDHFSAPRPMSPPSLIPDDWEDDLLQSPMGGNPSAGANSSGVVDPFAQPIPPGTFTGAPPVNVPPVPKASQTPAPQQPPAETITRAPVSAPQAPPAPAPAPEAVAPQPAPVEQPAPRPAPTPPTPAANVETSAPQGERDAAARAFLEALGAEDIGIKDKDLVSAMTRMGEVMRTMIEGVREVLMSRREFKSEFRIERTQIRRGDNNPLKFSVSPDQAVEAMLKPRAHGYMGARASTEEAVNDIKAHEVAMLIGMEAAIKSVLKRLDPLVLEEKIAKGGGISSLLKSRKARYWEIYEDMYAEISDQAENEFHDLFAKEFARAYQEQLEKLK